MTDKKTTASKPADDFIRIQDLWGIFMPRWHWFALSLFVTIKIASHYEEDTVYYRPEEIDLKRGMRVCIHGGKFDNVKGMFVRVQGKRNRRVVVLLEGVMAVSAEVHPDLIEVLS